MKKGILSTREEEEEEEDEVTRQKIIERSLIQRNSSNLQFIRNGYYECEKEVRYEKKTNKIRNTLHSKLLLLTNLLGVVVKRVCFANDRKEVAVIRIIINKQKSVYVHTRIKAKLVE